MNAVEWEERFAQWRIEYVLLSKQEPDTALLISQVRASKDWKVVFEDKRSILFAAEP